MSFSQEILKKVAPVQQFEKSREKRTYHTGDHPFRNTEKLPNGLFTARLRHNGKCVRLGDFSDRKRAGLASKLYRLWMDRGYDNIPNGSGHGFCASYHNTPIEQNRLESIISTYSSNTVVYQMAKELIDLRKIVYGK